MMSLFPTIGRGTLRFLSALRTSSFRAAAPYRSLSGDATDDESSPAKLTVTNDEENRADGSNAEDSIESAKSQVEKLLEFLNRADAEIEKAKTTDSDPTLADQNISVGPDDPTLLKTLGEWPPKPVGINLDLLMPIEEYDFLAPIQRIDSPAPPDTESFATMLRRDPLMELGDPCGAMVIGHVVEKTINQSTGVHIYIDIGGKFLTVGQYYHSFISVRGTKVLVRLTDLETVDHFLASDTYITMLEAKGVLLGRYNPEAALKKKLGKLSAKLEENVSTMTDKSTAAMTDGSTAAMTKRETDSG